MLTNTLMATGTLTVSSSHRSRDGDPDDWKMIAFLFRIVELRCFAGLSVEETAEVLDCSARTVKRDWRKARASLYRELASSAG